MDEFDGGRRAGPGPTVGVEQVTDETGLTYAVRGPDSTAEARFLPIVITGALFLGGLTLVVTRFGDFADISAFDSAFIDRYKLPIGVAGMLLGARSAVLLIGSIAGSDSARSARFDRHEELASIGLLLATVAFGASLGALLVVERSDDRVSELQAEGQSLRTLASAASFEVVNSPDIDALVTDAELEAAGCVEPSSRSDWSGYREFFWCEAKTYGDAAGMTSELLTIGPLAQAELAVFAEALNDFSKRVEHNFPEAVRVARSVDQPDVVRRIYSTTLDRWVDSFSQPIDPATTDIASFNGEIVGPLIRSVGSTAFDPGWPVLDEAAAGIRAARWFSLTAVIVSGIAALAMYAWYLRSKQGAQARRRDDRQWAAYAMLVQTARDERSDDSRIAIGYERTGSGSLAFDLDAAERRLRSMPDGDDPVSPSGPLAFAGLGTIRTWIPLATAIAAAIGLLI